MSARLLPRIAAGALAASLVFAMAPQAPALAQPPPGAAPYYLALGDSLAQGVQPDSAGHSVETNQGYADDLFALKHLASPSLRLVKLGCPGESTGTMINGGICTYPLSSQLASAVAFLQHHRVALVTIDIGANNIDSCVSAAGLDLTCLGNGVAAAAHDLPLILGALRQAAPGVPMVGMTYYDPFVAAALKGGPFTALAIQSEALGATFNQVLSAAYESFGFKVADVAGAFAPLNFASMPALDLPIDLALVCAYTWMCAPAPIGPNIHATVIGYGVIALAFSQQTA